jgi:hypothetical protein
LEEQSIEKTEMDRYANKNRRRKTKIERDRERRIEIIVKDRRIIIKNQQ